MVQVWIAPRATMQHMFAERVPFDTALVYALVMFVMSAAAAAALGVNGKISSSHAAFFGVGIVLVWLTYSVFLHGSVYLVGGRRGILATMTAYLIVVASLQPLFVMLLAGVVTYDPSATQTYEILMNSMGPSGGGDMIVEDTWRDLTAPIASRLRMICGMTVLVYFTIAIGPAQRITIPRSIAAAALSLGVWLLAGMLF